MPATWIGAGAAAIGAINGLVNSGGGGGSSGGWGSPGTNGTGPNAYRPLAGGIATSLNPSRAQVTAGEYSPPSNIGEGYNYIPTGQGNVDQLIQQILAGASVPNSGTAAGAVQPAATALLQQGTNPGAAQNYLRDVGTFTGQNDNWAGQNITAGYGLQNSGAGYIQQALAALPQYQRLFDMGFDPRQALYDRTLTQVQNQARSADAVRGLNASGVGAGIENQNTRNFNIDWQNQQLQRAIAAAGGFSQGLNSTSGALQTGGNLSTAGGNLIGQGANMRLNSIELARNAPYLSTLGQQQAIQQYLQTVGGAQGIDQQARAAEIAARLAPLQGAQNYLSASFQPNYLSNLVALKQAELVGNQNANAAAGISSGLDNIFKGIPGAVGGLSDLYKSIFGNSGPTTSSDGWQTFDPSIGAVPPVTGGTI